MNVFQTCLCVCLFIASNGEAMAPRLSVNKALAEKVLDLLQSGDYPMASDFLEHNPGLTAQHFAAIMGTPECLGFFEAEPNFMFESQEAHADVVRTLEGLAPVQNVLCGTDAGLQLIWHTLSSKPFERSSTVEMYFILKILSRWLETGYPDACKNVSLKLASYYGHTGTVARLLADLHVDPGHDEDYAIGWASKNGHANVVGILLHDKRVNPGAQNNYAIRMACGKGHTEVVKLLLNDSRIDPTAYDNWAVCLASMGGHTKVVELLLGDRRIDPADHNNWLIRWASCYNQVAIVSVLLCDQRVDPAAENNYAICKASKHGHAKVVETLLRDPRVDPTAQDNKAFISALKKGNVQIAALLYADPRVSESFFEAQVPGSTEAARCYILAKLAAFVNLLIGDMSTELGQLPREMRVQLFRALIASALPKGWSQGVLHAGETDAT